MVNFETLAPQLGDKIVEVGCHPGLLTLELARAGGSSGEIIGIDPSSDSKDRIAIAAGLAQGQEVADAVQRALAIRVISTTLLPTNDCRGNPYVLVFNYRDE